MRRCRFISITPLLNESKVGWLKLVNVVRFFELFSFCHASIEKEFNINIKVVWSRTRVYGDKTYFTILWSTPSRSCVYRIPGIIGTCLNLHIDKWTKALVITFNRKTVLIVITSVAVYLFNIIEYYLKHIRGLKTVSRASGWHQKQLFKRQHDH